MVGSNGAGKTTQSKLLIKFFNEKTLEPKKVISCEAGGQNVMYTVYNNGFCVIGKVGQNQCTGIDSVYGKLKADGVVKSIEMALNDDDVNIILAECIFATVSWVRKIYNAGFFGSMRKVVIHLDLTMWENFNRIQQRRAKKQGIEEWWTIPLQNTVYKNVGAKNRETRTIFEKLIGEHERTEENLVFEDGLKISAVEPENKIHKNIVNFIFDNL